MTAIGLLITGELLLAGLLVRTWDGCLVVPLSYARFLIGNRGSSSSKSWRCCRGLLFLRSAGNVRGAFGKWLQLGMRSVQMLPVFAGLRLFGFHGLTNVNIRSNYSTWANCSRNLGLCPSSLTGSTSWTLSLTDVLSGWG